MKTKKCKICKEPYYPERQLQQVCSPKCAIEYGNKHLAKQKKVAKTEARVALREFKKNDKPVLKELAQKLVNKYARLRDQLERGYVCCTCSHSTGQMDGGHFLPTSGYSAIRYNTNQIFQQCKSCNRFNGGMPKEYRIFMINRYGLEYVERLEATRGVLRSYSVEFYQRLIKIMRIKIMRLEAKLN